MTHPGSTGDPATTYPCPADDDRGAEVSTPDDTTVHWGEIRGVAIDFPMVVERMNQATLTFTVPAAAAAALVPGDAFDVAEVSPGQALFIMALVDYLENPWGDYVEVNLGVLVHPVGDPSGAGAFVYRMPVDQEFTEEAGNRVLGLPKTVEDLAVDYEPASVTFRLALAGVPELVVTFPRVPGDGVASSTDAITYSYLDGVPTALPLTIGIGTGVIDPAQVSIELGDGPVAAELRSLGLPTAPDAALWGEGLSGTFRAPRPLDA